MAVQGKPYHALIVDDDPGIRRLLARALRESGFICDTAPDGEIARQKLVTQPADLLVTDLRMPVRHGHRLIVETLGRKTHPLVAVVTGLVEPAIVSDLMMRGVSDVVLKPFDPNICAAKWLAMLRSRDRGLQPGAGVTGGDSSVASQLAVATDALRAQLRDITASFEETIADLEKKQENLTAGFLGSVRLLTQLMRQFDGAESTHAARVERLAEGICDRVGVDSELVRSIRLASLLHDLGQFGMPDSVRVTAPEKMSPSQAEAYRRYPEIGATLLSEVKGCEGVVGLVMAHTEAFDGSGFPNQIAGEAIPLGARIIRIADGVDTFLMYNHGPEVDDRLADHLVSQRARAYDPDLLDASFEFLIGFLHQTTTVSCTVSQLRIGDVLDEDLISPQGHIIARRGATVNNTMKTYVERIMGDVNIRIRRP